MKTNPDILAPANLSAAGTAAHAAIVKLLRKKRMTYTGGCRAFYSPAEWQARMEDHGKESELLVVYDGGDLGCFFEFDKMRPDLIEQMNQALSQIGMMAQPCTCWYAAIYNLPKKFPEAIFHLRLTPTDDDTPGQATTDGYGNTLLAALADLERATLAIYGHEAAFADNPTFVNEASEVLECLSAPNSHYGCFDMSCPEDAFRIDRLPNATLTQGSNPPTTPPPCSTIKHS